MTPKLVTIAIIRASAVESHDQMTSLVAALQAQDDEDVRPAWKLPPARLVLLEAGDPVPPGAWTLACVDTSDQPGALGYHVDAAGVPHGYAFMATTQQAGLEPSVTIAHELIEMRVDPTCTRYRSARGTRYALEACDPVEADGLGYSKGGHLLSDFILPAWFGGGKPGTPVDFRGRISQPHQLAPGGYMLVEHAGGQWQQVFGATPTHGAMGHPGASGRTARRVAAALAPVAP